MPAGATCSAALSRKNSVSSTASGLAVRGSAARGSRPVASGTGRVPRLEDVDRLVAPVAFADLAIEEGVGVGVLADDLLGPDRLVALAPALGGVVHDLLAQLEDAVHERLGARRAAGHVDVDRHELVGRDDRVVVEDAHRGGA